MLPFLLSLSKYFLKQFFRGGGECLNEERKMTVGFYRGLASQTERGSVALNVGALKFARKRSEGYFRENNRENICLPTWGRVFW